MTMDISTAQAPVVIAGASTVARECRQQLVRFRQTLQPLVLSGPEGIGKESFARAVHRGSARRQSPFIVLACDRLPSGLLFESQVYGHLPGAFAGLKTSSLGLIRSADGGTLYLDGIDALDTATRAKLFAALNCQAVTPLGGIEAVPVDVRVIAATTIDEIQGIQQLTSELGGELLSLPALADRRGDLPEIATQLLSEVVASLNLDAKQLSAEALEWIAAYEWPGNLRELRRVISIVAKLQSSRIDHRSFRLAMNQVNPRSVQYERPVYRSRHAGFAALRNARAQCRPA